MATSRRNWAAWLSDVIDGRRWSELSPAGKAVLPVIAKHANDILACWPGVRRVAELAGLSERSVKYAMKELVNAGLIRRQRKAKGKNAVTMLLEVQPIAPQDGLEVQNSALLESSEVQPVARVEVQPIAPHNHPVEPEEEERGKEEWEDVGTGIHLCATGAGR